MKKAIDLRITKKGKTRLTIAIWYVVWLKLRYFILSHVINKCWFHNWKDITKPVKMKSLPEGVTGYCQKYHEYECTKCGKKKGHLGDCHGGMQIID